MWPCKMLSVFLIVLVTCNVDVLGQMHYLTKSFKVPLDHFSFSRNETFNIKYLINDTYWDSDSGPIFFYTGNEGQIELFAKHTGFVWDIAEEFKARVVFAEHRYYGSSMPFGNKSLHAENIGFLTSSQALADYADLLNFLQGNGDKPKYPVIAFGGSYGGMLAAYFRMKYPHIINGAIAASAPIHQFTDMVPCDAFNRLVTSSFRIADGDTCEKNIRKSWAVIRNVTKTAEGKTWIKQQWNLCNPITNDTDVDELIAFLGSMYTTLAMVNYPFDCDFLVPLPGYPVRYVCEYLKDKSLNDKPLLVALGKVLGTFTNYTKKTPCVDYKQGDDYGNLDAAGWDFQACTEMVMPMCSTGKTDMFEEQPWDEKRFGEACKKKYNVYPSPDLAKIEYGGNRISAASNIVFSNGLLDPWASGGILGGLSGSLVTVIIKDGAHHLDLMSSNSADPWTVISARRTHKENIRRWIQDFQAQV